MLWKWIKKSKDLYDWYSFSSAIVSWIVLGGVVSGVGVSVVGVATAVIKGVPWPITLMAGVAIILAGACLVALPIFIRAAMPVTQPVSEPDIADEPMRPHWDAWKHHERFTVRDAACLLMNLEPDAANLRTPGVGAWIGALCAAVRTGELNPFKNLEGLPLGALMEPEIMRQRAQASWQTVIPKEALMDFATRNNIDLKNLGQ
jgi:hypothetical protein